MIDDVHLNQIDLIEDNDDVDTHPCSPSTASASPGALHDDDVDSVGASNAFAEIAAEVAVPDHDCLTVLCDGICPAELIVSSIVAAETKPTDLIVLLNLSSSSDVSSRLSPMELYVRDRLALLDLPLPMTKVSSAVPAHVRQRLYIAGHVFSMPTTTASVDLIQGVLPAHLIKGVIVLEAHRAVQGSREALVLRLIRDGCRSGQRPRPFLKLFTSNAAALDGDRHRLERVLGAVGVSQVHFWPRFRVRLRRVLSRTPIDDVAVDLSLTDAQKQIQAAVQNVLQICVDEALGSARRYLPDLALPEGNPLAAQPDLRLRRLLQPTWHRVGPKTRQLIADIALLRKLFALLVGTDCVSFYRFLRSVQATPRMQHSQWLLTPQADHLFKLAKRRVYSVASSGGGGDRRPRLVRHLQANPKWALLRQILDEIVADGLPRSGPVLIVCEDVASCGALRDLLRLGVDAYLEKRWFQFLQSLRLERVADDDDDKEQDGADEVSKAFAAKRIEMRLLRDEYRRLVEARRIGSTTTEPLMQTTLSQFGIVSKTTAKRRRKKVKVAAAPAPKPAPTGRSGRVSLSEALAAVAAGTLPTLLEDADDLPLMFWAKGADFIPLHLLNPMYIIVYDSDVGVLRQLEMAKSRRPSTLHRVYTVMYEDSIEDALHHERIRRECDVFEALAQQKAHMVLPSTDEAAAAPQADLGSTRQGGSAVPESVIIVDMREFRSSLPGTLYEAGVRIVPVTLEVGDYVLAPDLCVERKSVADLVGSLNSGRLFAQLTAMKRFYPHPFLLIEFDANDPFTFQLDLHGAVSASQICTRLAMICLAFPEIRIMWSRSPQATASIFARLKAGRPQPDVGKAATIANDDDDRDGGSYVASDMLRRLPGITPANLHQVMRSATCLADLAKLDRAALSKALGSRQAAAHLVDLLHADIGSG